MQSAIAEKSASINPLATSAQRELEALALEIFATAVVQRAVQQAARQLKTLVGRSVPQEAWPTFDSIIEEYAFHYVMLAVNADANHPKVLGNLFGGPHEWFGMKVPGNRCFGGENPDANYTVIPIDGYARFELHGRCHSPQPADVPITISGNNSLTMTLAILDWQDIEIGNDGRFVVTIGPEPANGRTNHMQTKLEARNIYMRDCRSDWQQIPNSYEIRRLDKPAAPPLTVEQMAERAARYIVDDMAAVHYFMAAVQTVDINTITAPINSAAIGGSPTQMISMGRFQLEDDEAFVLNFASGNAKYCGIALYDYWQRTTDYWANTSTMNNAQAAPNADGSTTYVISLRDPGVHNWLDPAGLHHTTLMHRWHALPRAGGDAPWSRGEVVKLRDLDRALPAAMKRVTPEERRQQLELRKTLFQRRFAVS